MIYHSDATASRQEGKFSGVGGLDLYYQSWHPGGEVRGILAIVHGLGGHSGLYKTIVEYLLPKEYAVYALDLRGHGRSSGQRGYINTWTEFRDDLQAFLNLIQQQQPGYPIFLLGHSLGGVIALDYTLHYVKDQSTLAGVIGFSPSIGQVGVPLSRVVLGKLFSRVWPRFSLHIGLDFSAGSRNQKILDSYTQDKLRHTLATARLSTEFFATVDWIHTHAEKWQVPLLILHGGADRIALPAGSQMFYEKVNYPDKLRIEYPGAYHNLHDDINYLEVITDLFDWMNKH
ncbi:alpha/beta hydrolase [Dolichospermum circinale]|uniref:alpha/beta hydrolase n=1 Tax=Dolichospermum circinale TaxID=109265 RepID=UPI000421F07B|nr:alpha/beta hydrolase [Dolichospermum circinale]MDB9473587.1 lysophospholipase [Dolichospermum circinale CS-537/11]MDB9478515.1 lysophospholipase [Dolichospermum circinale CS-537/03]MDB9483122.1 lysophospholipase [Dolichospermum circinale CS-537/05]